MTIKEIWCTPVCELVACVDPELQAGADRLYYCTIHPRHHMVAKVDLSQTQIQWRTYSQEHALQSHNPSVLVHPGMQPKEMASFLSSTVSTFYLNFHPAHIFLINNTPQRWILSWQIVWNIYLPHMIISMGHRNSVQMFYSWCNGFINSLIYILKPNRNQWIEMIFTIMPIEAKPPVGGGWVQCFCLQILLAGSA